MSIFDKDIHLPIEHLYDVCKDIVQHVIPMNMMHYNGQCETMQRDIMFELKNAGLLTSRFKSLVGNQSVNKISKVDVEFGEYIRRIPTYIVKFYFPEEIIDDFWVGKNAVLYYDKPFVQFTVGINGIIDESIL